ncbi:MAG: site-specific DNA-methyltransferase [Candidatus Pacebacteria bacterium]|nr:site-specific DNA-methyltransferase [Candidatus Paceibacterota bacterium]
MKNKFKNKFYKILKKDNRLWDEKTKKLNETLLKDLIDKLDEKIIELLFGDKEMKEKFFIKVKDIFVLKQNDLKFFIDENKLDNSYTQYQNKIGLRVGNKLLSERNEVVLDWPFKDCVLEGGMTKEDQKRNEIFFNEVLAKDEIDRLYDSKALVNWKRYTVKGGEKVKELKRDKDGTIKENLIIKGNNLLALHSLKGQFAGKVKLIYIDPPYNIGKDDFGYNDNFNHSTWLTFMKNRLKIAHELLAKEGAIFVQIDHHEIAYLNTIMDEIFGSENKAQIISVKVSAASGFKAVNPGPIDVTEFILFYTKSKSNFGFHKNYIETGYHKNYNLYLENKGNIKNWKLLSLKDKVLKENGYKNEKELKKKFGAVSDLVLLRLISEFAFSHAKNVVSIRDLHKPSEKVRELQEKSRKDRNEIILYKKRDGSYAYLINGGALAFYSSKIKEIDGELKVTELLTNYWNHISWAGIAREGGVKLKNGKKPEKLIKQIIEVAGAKKNDIVLDFFSGSGTTCAVAHKLNIQYIGVEQLDYEGNNPESRLKEVIGDDQSGISKIVNWKGGGDFVYLELAKWNEEAKEKILKAKSLSELEKLFNELYEKYFLNYNVKTKEFKEKTIKEEGFKNLSLNKQKKLFVEMLDMNQMYVNFSERADKKYKLTKEDIALSEEFYNSK